MTLKNIYETLNNISPFDFQEKWDNSGVIIGDMQREISHIVLSLDIDKHMISDAKDGTLFIVHHPLIFAPLPRLDFARYPDNLIEMMIQKSQSCIAMHTNFDKTHLNEYVFTEILGFTNSSKQELICIDKIGCSSDEIIELLQTKLQLPALRVVNKKESIRSIAMTTGAGASLMDEVDADCFLTGDIKYHDAMKATSQNLMMIDIGHYESERFFADIMYRELEHLGISAIIMQSQNPFTTNTKNSQRNIIE